MINYFELFEIPCSFTVDASILAKKYFALQKQFHPDFFTQDDEDAQSNALQKTAEINKGLKILKNTDETIKYVLQLKNLLVEDEKYQLPNSFLMEMMDFNEAIDDDTQQQVMALQQQLLHEIQPILNSVNIDELSNNQLLQVKEYYFKKKYLQRILDRLAG
jgi:molecular chaperone HscB